MTSFLVSLAAIAIIGGGSLLNGLFKLIVIFLLSLLLLAFMVAT